jgi:O-antigen/teichoic acid export membrane protein
MSVDALETFPTETQRPTIGALGRTSLVYALGGLAYKGVAVVTVPIFARLLAPNELGLLDLAALIATVLGLAAALGSDQAVAFLQTRTSDEGRLWGSTLAVVLCAAACVVAAAVVFQSLLANVLTGDATNAPVIAAAAIYSAVIALSATALNAIRLRGTPLKFAIASFIMVSAEMAVALGVAVSTSGTVPLMVLGWAAGAAVVAIPVLVRHLPRLAMPDRLTARRIVAFGVPLVPATVAWLVGESGIRSALAHAEGLSSLGAYGIAFRIASVLGLVVTGFGVAWYPVAFRDRESGVPGNATQPLSILIVALAGCGVAISALSPEVVSVVAGPGYEAAAAAVAPLVGGMTALGAVVLLGGLSGRRGSTWRIAVAAVLGAVVQVTAAALLVAPLGLPGAGLSSLTGYLLAAGVLITTERTALSHGLTTVVLAAGLASVGFLGAWLVVEVAPLPIRVGMAVAYALVCALWIGRGTKAARAHADSS